MGRGALFCSAVKRSIPCASIRNLQEKSFCRGGDREESIFCRWCSGGF